MCTLTGGLKLRYAGHTKTSCLVVSYLLNSTFVASPDPVFCLVGSCVMVTTCTAALMENLRLGTVPVQYQKWDGVEKLLFLLIDRSYQHLQLSGLEKVS